MNKPLVDNLRRIRIHGSPKPRLGQFIEPVQLQVVCYQLWENLNRKQQPATTIRMAELRTLGDVDTALGQFYEQALTKVIQLTKEREHTLRSWFNDELITEAGTRGIVYQGETKTGGIQNETVEQLANQYLLHAEMRAGGVWYELTHDRFVEPIKKSNDGWFAQRRERRLRIGGITGLIVMILLCAVISLWFSINLSVTTNAANAAESTAQAAKTLNALQASNAMLDTIKVQAIAATATTQWLNDDSDGDGLTNEEELQFGTDPTLADSDFDGVPDNEEISNLSDPTNRDSDNDGTPDAFDTDPVPGPTATPVVVTIGFSNPQPYLNQSFFSSQENRYQINEDEGAAIIQVELSESVDREIQMDYGVEITNAAENVDYRLNGSTLTFNPGDMLKTIEVEVIPNPQRTENALLVLALSNPPPGVNLGLDRIELVITSEQ